MSGFLDPPPITEEARALLARLADLPDFAAFAHKDAVPSAYQSYIQAIATLLQSGGALLPDESGYVYALVDVAGRMAFGVTAEGVVKGKIELLPGAVTQTSLDAALQGKLPTDLPVEAGIAWVLADINGRGALVVHDDGRITGPQLIPGDGTVGMTQLAPNVAASFPGTAPAETGYAYSVTSDDGRQPLGIRSDGTTDLLPSDTTLDRIGKQMGRLRFDPRESGGSDVVLMIGQSNAQGAGIPWDAAIDIQTDGIDQLAGSGPYVNTVIPAIESLFHVTWWRDDNHGLLPRVGPVMEFARQFWLRQPVNRRVLIVPAAQGSTSISGDATYSWDPDNTTAATNLYTRAIAKTQLALSLNPKNRLVAILWHQGEGDTGVLTQAQYRTKLLQIIDGLRAQFGADVPFLVGAMTPEWRAVNAGRLAIDAAHREIPGQRPRTAFVEGPSGMSQDDAPGIHYNAAGARQLGRNYYAAYKTIIGA